MPKTHEKTKIKGRREELLTAFLLSSKTNYFVLRASLNCLPATNFGWTEAGIWIVAPVAGLRPVRASRLADLKVPKPTKEISSPALTVDDLSCQSIQNIFNISFRFTGSFCNGSNQFSFIHSIPLIVFEWNPDNKGFLGQKTNFHVWLCRFRDKPPSNRASCEITYHANAVFPRNCL